MPGADGAGHRRPRGVVRVRWGGLAAAALPGPRRGGQLQQQVDRPGRPVGGYATPGEPTEDLVEQGQVARPAGSSSTRARPGCWKSTNGYELSTRASRRQVSPGTIPPLLSVGLAGHSLRLGAGLPRGMTRLCRTRFVGRGMVEITFDRVLHGTACRRVSQSWVRSRRARSVQSEGWKARRVDRPDCGPAWPACFGTPLSRSPV